MATLQINGVRKSFGALEVLKNIDLELDDCPPEDPRSAPWVPGGVTVHNSVLDDTGRAHDERSPGSASRPRTRPVPLPAT